MRDVWGYRVYEYRPQSKVVRHWLTVPRVNGYPIRVLFRDHFRVYRFYLGRGWVWTQWGDGGRTAIACKEMPFQWRWLMAVQRRSAPSDKTPPPPLPVPLAVLVNSPLLAEHITATKFEDGLVRVPGSFKVENIGTAFRVTVYDHDAGLRLPVTGPTLEEALQEVETILGVPDAPWEVDRYLSEQVARRGKKKK